jgi:predicted Zn-dependent protease
LERPWAPVYYHKLWYDNSTFEGYADFNPEGEFVSGDEEYEDDGDYGDGAEFDIAASTGSSTTTSAPSFNAAQFAATLPNNATATNEAQIASDQINFLTQAPSTGPNSADQALFEGAKWGSNVITWSLADSAAPADSPFSSYMSSSQYDSLVEQAFAAWGQASGLTFEQVSDSSQSDIRIGWGDFNTASSGVVGYTTYQMQDSQLQPGVVIRLEDPSQDPILTSATNANAPTSATNAYLYEVMMHEIGHALGLADNDDPNSVMYYKASSSNTTLDSNDVSGIQGLYNPAPLTTTQQAVQTAASELSGASVNSMVQQMAQANASFFTQPGSSTTVAAQQAENPIASLVANHMSSASA